MAQIKTEKEYNAAMARIDELLPLTWADGVPEDSPENIELNLLSELVAEYEDIHYPIGKPSLIDIIKLQESFVEVSYTNRIIIKLRMYEMGLSQKAIAAMLGISEPRMSEIMHGKTEPSLSLARTMSQKLNIDANVVLGV